MKLLLITQKVDRSDPILGFFTGWISEFASQCERVTVIAQQEGEYQFGDSVRVFSLGKEDGQNVWQQIVQFWKCIWQQRNTYDRVLVHMTPIWVILGAPVWFLLRKKVYLWYEIRRGGWKLNVALFCVKKVFAASTHGLPFIAKKQMIVGHGIDTTLFCPAYHLREKNHLVAVGRITAIKHYEIILRTLSKLPACRLTIAGGTVTDVDKTVEVQLHAMIHRLHLADRIEIGWVSPDSVPQLLQRADCMLHASQGGLDKVVLQAMACGCSVVSTSNACADVLPEQCKATEDSLLQQTEIILALSDEERRRLGDRLRETVIHNHSLTQCISRMVKEMER